MADQTNSNQKKVLTYVFWGALIIAGAFALWYFVFRDTTQCDPYRPGFDTDGKPTDKCKLGNASSTTPPPPSIGVGSSWKDEAFPLEKGMYGLKIKALQQALGITADGKFGPQTEAAVKIKLGKTKVDQPDYEKLVPNPATPPNISTATTGKIAYSTQAAVPIFDSPNDYVPYRVAGAGEKLGEYLGTKKSWFGVPYARIKWEGGGEKYVEMKYITFTE